MQFHDISYKVYYIREGKVSYFYDANGVVTYGWIDLITRGLLPFWLVESAVYRQHIKYSHMSCTIFDKITTQLTRCAQNKIKTLLPDTFTIAFDRWTEGEPIACLFMRVFLMIISMAARKSLLGFLLSRMSSAKTRTSTSCCEYMLKLFSNFCSNVVVF